MHMPLDGYLYHPRTHHVKLRLLIHNKKLKLALMLGHNFTLTWYFPWSSCFQTSFIFLEWLDQVDKARGKLLHISYNAKFSLDTMKLAQVWLGSLITMPTYSLRVEPPFVFLMRRKKGSSNSTFYWSMFILDLQNDGLTLLDYIKCEHHKYLGNQVWCDWTMISRQVFVVYI